MVVSIRLCPINSFSAIRPRGFCSSNCTAKAARSEWGCAETLARPATRFTQTVAGGTTTNYDYTSDGQTASQGTTSYTWDGWGRLKTATVGSNTITYTYDPTGALMTRSSSSPASTINYLLGDLFETNAAGSIATSYTDVPAGNLASYAGPPTSTSTVSYLYYDEQGNLAAEANSSGTLTASHTYDPFGAPTDTVPSNTTVHRFVGRWNKEYDTTTGLILMGARPYNPATGRFLTTDPIPGGSLNNYDYAGQDPINGYDLNGESCWSPSCAWHAIAKAGGWLAGQAVRLAVAGEQAVDEEAVAIYGGGSATIAEFAGAGAFVATAAGAVGSGVAQGLSDAFKRGPSVESRAGRIAVAALIGATATAAAVAVCGGNPFCAVPLTIALNYAGQRYIGAYLDERYRFEPVRTR